MSVADILLPLNYRVLPEAYKDIPFVGRKNELVQLAFDCATNVALHRQKFLDTVGKPIISQSPQMFGSGKTRLGLEFARAIRSPEISTACRLKLNESVTEQDLDVVLKCEAISIDINENAMLVTISSDLLETSLALLLARGLNERLDEKAKRNQFIENLPNLNKVTVKTVLEAYSTVAPGIRVFVHVDEVGFIQTKCAEDEILKQRGALTVFRDFRDSLLKIVKAGHFVFVTGNTPILFALGKSEKHISPCVTRTILLDPLRENDVAALVRHVGCEECLVESVAKNVVDATAGIPRLVLHCINLMKARKLWKTSQLSLEDFNIDDQFDEWNPPPASESLRKLLIHALYDIEVCLDDEFQADVVCQILNPSDIISPKDGCASVLEACRAFNLFLTRNKENRWHVVWPRVILLKWKKYWEDHNISEMSILCKSVLEEPGMVDAGKMLEVVVKRTVRRRIVTAIENAANNRTTLVKAFPFLSDTAFATKPIVAADGLGRYEYMPKIVKDARVPTFAYLRSKGEVLNNFSAWSAQLTSEYKNDGKSTTLNSSGAPKSTWTCHIDSFPELRSAMPKNCIYDPLDKSSSEDLLVRFSTCDLKIQDKNTKDLQPHVLGKEIEKVLNQQLDCPTLLIIAAVMPEGQYNLPEGGKLVMSTNTAVHGEETFEAGKVYTASDCNWKLGEHLHVLYLNESGMRQFIHDEDFDHIRNGKTKLVELLSPRKNTKTIRAPVPVD